MKLSKLVGDRFKEKPAGAVIDSHALMLRGGYMKFVGSGISRSSRRSTASPPRSRRSCARRWTKSMGRRSSSP